MGTDAALEMDCSLWVRESTAQWQLARMLNRGPAFKGENYVSKALVGTILDAFWPKCGGESHKTRRVFHFLHRDRQRGPEQGDVILDRAYTTRATLQLELPPAPPSNLSLISG